MPVSLFESWLRRGGGPAHVRSESAPETKGYNPWRWPESGEFAPDGQGRYYGNSGEVAGTRVAMSRVPSVVRRLLRKAPDDQPRPAAPAKTAPPTPRKPPERPDGRVPAESRPAPSKPAASGSERASPSVQPSRSQTRLRQEQVDGDRYLVDQLDRTRVVSATVRLDRVVKRSRGNQRRAGGPDRRPTDDGGHIVGHGLGGSPRSLNLIAQDSKLNRGRYRVMEQEIAREAARGRPVKMRVLLKHDGPSRRPDELVVRYSVQGKAKVYRFKNAPEKKSVDEIVEKNLLIEIAESCAGLIDGEGDFVLYVQADDEIMATSIYHDRGELLVYVQPDDELVDLIENFRQASAPEDRWSSMNLVMHGVKFDATFQYGASGLDFGETDEDDPRHRAAWAALGKKPIEYPEIDPNEEGEPLKI